MKRLNNKGYMLVEIILAFSVAMTITYFVTELTIKVKNKNDDLLVRTLTSTDQAIIYNMIMDNIYKGGTFSCNDSMFTGTGKKMFEYNGKSVIVNDYVDEFKCDGTKKIIIKVNALPDYNFDVVIPS